MIWNKNNGKRSLNKRKNAKIRTQTECNLDQSG